MAFTVTQLSTKYSNEWKFKNMLGGSKIAVLFPNSMISEGGRFGMTVQFPVMTEAATQENWDQTTGFKETDATEQIVEIKLSQNFTVYVKIAKVNVPAAWETWATGKMTTINRQEATQLDNYVLKTMAAQVTNSIEGEAITSDNLVDIISQMKKKAESLKSNLEDHLIFASSNVINAIIKSNIEMGVTSIENTSAKINKILNRYNIVEANVDDYGFEMISVLPSAFAWASAVETPLQAGEYTQGPFFGQIFTVLNRFYEAKILLPEFVIGYKVKATVPPDGSSNANLKTNSLNSGNSLDVAKRQAAIEVKTEYSEKPKFKSAEALFHKDLVKARTYGKVRELVDQFPTYLKNA